MNTKELLADLSRYLAEFDVHALFTKEIAGLLKKELRGKETRFLNGFLTQLENLKNFGRMVYTVDSNEILKGMDGHYYSLHVQNNQMNVRLLVHIDDNGLAKLLCAFYERDGKQNTDYSAYTKIMEQRFNDLSGGNEDA